MRHRILSSLALLIFICAGASSTHADDHSVYVAPGPRTIIAPANFNPSQAETTENARKLGDLIGGSLTLGGTHATDVLVTTQCGRYKSAMITYADGTVKSLNLSNAPATKTDLQKAKAAIPILRVVDVADCNS